MTRTRNQTKKDNTNDKKVSENTDSGFKLQPKAKPKNIKKESDNTSGTTNINRLMNPLNIAKRSSKVSSIKTTKNGRVLNSLNINKRHNKAPLVKKSKTNHDNLGDNSESPAKNVNKEPVDETDDEEESVRRSGRKRNKEPVDETDDEEEPVRRSGRKRNKEPVDETDDEEEPVRRSGRKRNKEPVDETDDEEEPVRRSGRKRNKEPVDETDDEEEPVNRTGRKQQRKSTKINSSSGSTRKATKRTHGEINGEPDVVPEAPAPPKKKHKKRSIVWHHFEEANFTVDGVEGRYAKCKYCVKKYRLSHKSNAGTGNMFRHLNNKHCDKLGNEPAEFHVFTQENFRKTLLRFVVATSQPFSVVEEETFVEFVRLLNPSAELISDKTMRADVMAAFYEQIEKMKLQLKDVPGKISITLDCWTSKNVLSFLVIRAHWISSEWELKTQLLDFFPIEEDHSGENLCQIFMKCIDRFNIPLSKILAYTMDNATNNDTFITALKKHGIKIGVNVSAAENQVRCLAHIFNLAVQDMLKVLKVPYIEADGIEDEFMDDSEDELEDEDEENEEGEAEIEDAEEAQNEDNEQEEEDVSPGGKTPTGKLRKLVRKIRKSTKLRRQLRKLCVFYKVKPLVPKIDVSTRWNSTYKMILRAEHLRVPLGALSLDDKSLQSLRLMDSEWDDLKDIKVLLQKFDRATQMISMERHSTFASYLPTMNWLLDYLTATCQNEVGLLRSAAAVGLDKLTKYSLSVNESKLPYIATILNPALKVNYFKEHEYNRATIDNINETLSDYFSENYETHFDSSENAELEDELYAHIYKRTTKETVSKELERYLSLPLSPPKVTDILAFWKAQEGELPCMSKMARDILAAQTTSVAVERDNSAGADVVTPSRCSLKGETVQATMCLQRWLMD